MQRAGAGSPYIALLVIFALLVPSLLPSAFASQPITITMKTSVKGETLDLTLLAIFPITVQLAVKNPAPGATFLWDFGDGTNSTDQAPPHAFTSPFVYVITLHMSSPNGTQSSGTVKFAAMDRKGPNGAIAVFPPRGTYGFTPVKVAGAYFAPQTTSGLLVNGTLLANVKADSGGIWVYDASNALPASPNGTKFVFTTNPVSLTRQFLTVEGVEGSAGPAGAGDSVLVEGRSYPANSAVQVYVNGVNLGVAQADGTGSFSQGFSIPAAQGLSGGGRFPYATFPPVLGTQASVSITGFSIATGLLSWWWLILLIVGGLLIYFFVIRPARSRRREAVPLPTV